MKRPEIMLRKARRATLMAAVGLAVLAGTTSAQPRLGNELVASPEVWRGFRPLVIAAGDGDAQRAAGYLRQGTQILRKAEANLSFDLETESFRTKSRESFERFDFERLYALLPVQKERVSSVCLSGRAHARRLPRAGREGREQ